MVKTLLLLLFITGICPDFAFAKVRVSGIFSDDMVLQRGEPLSVWGTAEPKKQVRVSFNASSVICRANAKGRWSVSLPSEKAGGPYTLAIQAGQELITFKNILVGDVWFASGQSNMEHPMGGWKWLPDSDVYRSEEEIADSDYPEIRLLTVPKHPSSVAVDDLPEGACQWQVADPQSVRNFSSTAWFFGKELHSRLKIPIGIINCSWAGTSIKTWISQDVLTQFRDSIEAAKTSIPSEEVVTKTILDNQARRCQITYPAAGQLDQLNRLPKAAWQPIRIPAPGRKLQEVTWIKKDLYIPEGAAKEPLELSLGFVSWRGIVYLNGTEVGSSVYPEQLLVLIPRRLIRPGKNTLIVRLAQPFGTPLVLGDKELFHLSTRDQSFRHDLSGEWLVNTSLDTIPPAREDYRNFPGALFNGMVSPCQKLNVKGIIWYQGEDDVHRPQLYKELFKSLILDWRAKWHQKDLPFLYVQISSSAMSHKKEFNPQWSIFREYQQVDLPNTGRIVSLDIGDPYDVHPRNKKEIGHRLAQQAMQVVY